MVEQAEKRAEVLAKVVNEKNEKEENPMEERREERNMNKEYRSAYLKKLMGRELNEEETRAFAQSGVTGAMPQETSETIITKITKLAPVLNDITLLNVKGGVKFAVEGAKAGASIHAENSTINPDADTLVTVTLGGFEVTKFTRIQRYNDSNDVTFEPVEKRLCYCIRPYFDLCDACSYSTNVNAFSSNE